MQNMVLVQAVRRNARLIASDIEDRLGKTGDGHEMLAALAKAEADVCHARYELESRERDARLAFVRLLGGEL